MRYGRPAPMQAEQRCVQADQARVVMFSAQLEPALCVRNVTGLLGPSTCCTKHCDEVLTYARALLADRDGNIAPERPGRGTMSREHHRCSQEDAIQKKIGHRPTKFQKYLVRDPSPSRISLFGNFRDTGTCEELGKGFQIPQIMQHLSPDIWQSRHLYTVVVSLDNWSAA